MGVIGRKEKTKWTEEIIVDNVQVFPGVITDQDLELIPLSEFPDSWNKAEIFDTPAQNL